MENYSAYLLTDKARNELLAKFPPKYSKVVAHHITVKFGAPNAEPPAPAMVAVVGYIDSGDGLEALVCSVNGTTERADGSKYHITWSLEPGKYSPKDSNALLRSKRFTLTRAYPIETTPEVL